MSLARRWPWKNPGWCTISLGSWMSISHFLPSLDFQVELILEIKFQAKRELLRKKNKLIAPWKMIFPFRDKEDFMCFPQCMFFLGLHSLGWAESLLEKTHDPVVSCSASSPTPVLDVLTNSFLIDFLATKQLFSIPPGPKECQGPKENCYDENSDSNAPLLEKWSKLTIYKY